jgi:dolichol-phosphate mannosyltransferase
MDVDVICQMDADFSHDPQYLPALVQGVVEGGNDLVIGSRYLQGVSVVNWPLSRLILSTFANRYVRGITGLPARDCTSGYRCWRREALARLPLQQFVSDGYAFLVEMLYEAMGVGCRIGEVPIIYVERREGQSKMSHGVIFESVFVPWRLVLRHPSWRGRRG